MKHLERFFFIFILFSNSSQINPQQSTCEGTNISMYQKGVCPAEITNMFTNECNIKECSGCKDESLCKILGCTFSNTKCSGTAIDPFNGSCEDKYVLHYFGGNGRAVLARAILSFAKADWKNEIINYNDWPKIKKSGLCEFEQVPVLEVNGKKLAQSMAISYYLARKFDLMGNNMEENYEIDSLLGCFPDIAEPIWKFSFSKEKDKIPELRQAALEKFKFFIKKIEDRYIRLGKGKYFLGNKFTLADIFIGAAIPSFRESFGEVIVPKVAPILADLIKRLKENELKEFHEKYFISNKK